MDKIEKLLNQILEVQNKTNESLEKLESQTGENTQILNALRHNSEEHKALLDQLNHRFANVEGKITSIKNDITEIKENNKSINEILGEHEVSIRSLRRRPV